MVRYTLPRPIEFSVCCARCDTTFSRKRTVSQTRPTFSRCLEISENLRKINNFVRSYFFVIIGAGCQPPKILQQRRGRRDNSERYSRHQSDCSDPPGSTLVLRAIELLVATSQICLQRLTWAQKVDTMPPCLFFHSITRSNHMDEACAHAEYRVRHGITGKILHRIRSQQIRCADMML